MVCGMMSLEFELIHKMGHYQPLGEQRGLFSQQSFLLIK